MLLKGLLARMVKNLPSMQETPVSIPELGISPGKESDNPLQHSCLEHPMDREAWQAIGQGVTES